MRPTEILETFPRVFCFRKSRINENGGNVRAATVRVYWIDTYYCVVIWFNLLRMLYQTYCQSLSCQKLYLIYV